MYKILVDGELFCDSRVDDLAIISPVVTNEINKAGSFKFTIPPTHPYYDMIERRSSIVEVYRDEDTEPIFAGMAVSISDDFFKQRSVECEGELSFLNDTIQRPHRYQGMTVRQLLETYLNIHNSLCENAKHFTVGQVTVEDPNDYIYCYTNYDTTLKSIAEDLVDDLGGFLRIRHVNGVRYLDYLKESPNTNSQVIRLGENLIDFDTSLDTTELATVVIPLGAILEEGQTTSEAVEGLDERLTIKSVNGGKDYLASEDAVEAFGWIEQTVVWDGVTTASALKTKGEKYLSETQFEDMTITANAIDLHFDNHNVESFKILDQIRVISTPHGLDRYFVLSKITYNLNNPENDQITLGTEEKNTISATTKSVNEDIIKRMERVPTSSMVQNAIANATQLITGAQGGYIVMKMNNDGQPIEMYVQDALENPTKMWRWNVNGLGYSNDGGETYGLAMTMNGAIVADYITSGTMYADRIRGGSLKLGGVDNQNGVLEIYNGDDEKVATWDNYAITIDSAEHLYKTVLSEGAIEVYGSDNGSMILCDDFSAVKRAGETGYNIGSWLCGYEAKALMIGSYKNREKTDLGGGYYFNKTLHPNGYREMHIYFGSERHTGKMYLGNTTGAWMEAVTTEGVPQIEMSGLRISDGGSLYIGNIESLFYGKTVFYSTQGTYCPNGVYIGTSNTFWIKGNASESGLVTNGIFTASNISASSDRRLKENIEDLPEEYVELIDELDPKTFAYKENGVESAGFIAQEVIEECEKLGLDDSSIVYGDEEDFYSMNYNSMIAILWKGLQDARRRISELEEERNEHS